MAAAAEATRAGAEERATASGRFVPAGLLVVGLLTGLFGWWGWREGAYFEAILLPGAIVLCAGLIAVAVAAPLPRLRPAAGVALAALLLLAAWSAISAIWSPVPDVAIGDAQRITVYAMAFAAGAWAYQLLGARGSLTLVPIVVAAGSIGVITGIQLLVGDSPRDLLQGGTVDYPLGYRNATAAFFSLGLIPAAALAADGERNRGLRAVAFASGTVCASLFILCQSRASAPAIAAAILVYLLVAPLRLRALGWLVLIVIPALGTLPAVVALYEAVGDDGARAATAEMNAAGAALLIAAGAALLIGAAATRFGDRLPILGSTSPRSNRPVAIALGVTVAAAAVAFVVAVGDPVDWAEDRLDEFRETPSPDLSDRSIRFTFNAGSERYEMWQVALTEAGDDPLKGTGGGGFHYAFMRERETDGTPVHDAHSIELEVLSELGLPGLALLGAMILAAAIAVCRTRLRNPGAAALAAAALGSGTYWLLHSSVDWFWAYPAVTAPVLALLGAAASAAGTNGLAQRTTPWRTLIVAALVLFALTTIPPFLSQRYTDAAYGGWRTDLGRAYDDLDRARALNPLDDDPWLAEGAIARASGDAERAVHALSEAARLQPEEWATHYLLAKLLADSQPSAARREIRIALSQNPESSEVRALADRLESTGAKAEAPQNPHSP